MTLNNSLGCAALAIALLTSFPALAQTSDTKPADATKPADTTKSMNCSEASMKAMHDSMMKMTDANKKAATMKEMDMATAMMAKKDEKGCMMHMDKAMGMMK
jgi:hypothetical protein